MLTGPSACIGARMNRLKRISGARGHWGACCRFVAWALPVMPSLMVAVTVSALTPAQVTAQSLVVSPRVSVMGGNETAWSAGPRVEVGSIIAVFGQFGVLHVSQRCDLVFPPSCTTPSSAGLELLGGVRLALPRLGPVRPAISLGAGTMVWNDDQPFESGTGSVWEAELRVGVNVASWADLLLGGVVKSVGQSVSGGMRLERDRGTYGGVVIGLLIPLM